MLVGAVLMDLSKAFDCIPHDILIAKMHAYGFSKNTLTFFYSYLKRRKQYVKINEKCSDFKTILTGVPQGSILGPVLFNLFINDLFYSIKEADLYNFADDNTISCAAKCMPDLIHKLETESENAVNWFRDNQMIVNPQKFQSIIIDRKNQTNNPQQINVEDKLVASSNKVQLIGLTIDSRLNFETHISSLCQKSASQLNALCRLSSFLDFKERNILINSFVYSNFNYCALVWHFCSKKSLLKIENIQKRALRFLLNDYESDYDSLLKTSDKITMEIRRLRNIETEVFKTLKNKNPTYMNELFETQSNSLIRANNLKIPIRNSVTFGDSSLRCLGPKIWNSLPDNIKTCTTYKKFKELISTWTGPECKCRLCDYLN